MLAATWLVNINTGIFGNRTNIGRPEKNIGIIDAKFRMVLHLSLENYFCTLILFYLGCFLYVETLFFVSRGTRFYRLSLRTGEKRGSRPGHNYRRQYNHWLIVKIAKGVQRSYRHCRGSDWLIIARAAWRHGACSVADWCASHATPRATRVTSPCEVERIRPLNRGLNVHLTLSTYE